MKYSPVVLFVYSRLKEVKLTIESLKKNKNSKDAKLIIFSDYPKSNEDEKKVQEVRNFLRQIKGFKNVEIIERKENFGLARNIIEGVTDVINVYNKVIVLEDDLITSSNFLCYMNKALDFYKDDNKIFSISGYSMNLKILKYYNFDTYFYVRPSSWGWATWKDRWNSIDWDIRDYENFIKNKFLQRDFNKGGADLTRMLKHYFEGKNNSWAIRWSYNMWRQKKYCVYPTVSKIQNIGFGENATHCKSINIYRTNLDKSNKCLFNFATSDYYNDQIEKEFRFQYSYINKFFKKLISYLNEK
jgi:hypothetical protein